MFKTLALLALAALALLFILAATRPDHFRVERSIRVQAPPERIHALIEDLRRFNTWNPYEKKDPALKGRYGDTTRGPGASYAWDSSKVGVGRMTITAVTAPSRVAMALDFEKPFAAHNQVEFTLQPDNGATRVTWAMSGPSPFPSKLIGLVFSMDRMIGQDFEQGLASLKALAEAP
ncbi:MAG: SRPBCC family protein [Burkholderiales bacterium]|nr:SRPBCC family protein [Burkholderiales bacterium]